MEGSRWSGCVETCPGDQGVWTLCVGTRKWLCCWRRGVVARGWAARAGQMGAGQVGGQVEVMGRWDRVRAGYDPPALWSGWVSHGDESAHCYLKLRHSADWGPSLQGYSAISPSAHLLCSSAPVPDDTFLLVCVSGDVPLEGRGPGPFRVTCSKRNKMETAFVI